MYWFTSGADGSERLRRSFIFATSRRHFINPPAIVCAKRSPAIIIAMRPPGYIDRGNHGDKTYTGWQRLLFAITTPQHQAAQHHLQCAAAVVRRSSISSEDTGSGSYEARSRPARR